MKTILNRVEAIKDLIQEAVDKGVTSVEEIHNSIIMVPISELERHGLTETARAARDLQDLTIGTVYRAIHMVNQEIGELASGFFQSAENFVDTQAALSGKNDR